MRLLRRQRWLAIVGFAALAIQFAAAFGHHHVHTSHKLESLNQLAGKSAASEATHDDSSHSPHHSDEDFCEICWSLATLASLTDPVLAPLAVPDKAKQASVAPGQSIIVALRLARANLPRGPPLTLLN